MKHIVIKLKLIFFLVFLLHISAYSQDFKVYSDIINTESSNTKIGHFDSDPLPDIAYFDINSVSISLNSGKKLDEIEFKIIYQSINPIQQIEVADFDFDGVDDILVLEQNYGSMILLKNEGSGSFVHSTLIDSCKVKKFQTIDIDADEDLDIFGTSQSKADTFTDQSLIYYHNEANVEFVPSILYSKKGYFVSDQIRFIDIDKDGDLDVFYHYCVTGWNLPVPFPPFYDEYLLFIHDENGMFKGKLIKKYGLSTSDIQFADMNKDGLLDIIITTVANTTGYDILLVAFQKSDQTFEFKDISPDQQNFIKDGVGFNLIDLNQDGNLDIVYRTRNIQVALNLGNKNFNHKILIQKESNYYFREFTMLDFDNDGLEDILVTYNSTGLLGTPKTWVLYKMTDRNLLSFEKRDSIYQESENEYGLWHIIDIDQDGFPDVLGDRGRSFIFHNLNKTNSIYDSNNIKLENITIYPNPASDFINIEMNGLIADEVIIINEKGQVVKSFDNNTDLQKDIDISDMNDGVYYVVVYDEKGIPQGFDKIIKTDMK